MKNILKLFPSLATTLALFILPVIMTIYFVITKYSDKFVTQQNITYFDVQNNWLGVFFVSQTWLTWFNRFMDFALWGVLAAVVLIGVWMVSSARVAMNNHQAEQSFENFKDSKNSWHTHFLAVAVVKVLLVVIMLICLGSIVGQAVPLLATNISFAIHEFSLETVWPVIYTGLLMVFLQFLFLTCIKVYKITHADE